MSNNSESVERIVGSNPGSTATPSAAKSSEAVNSGKMSVSDARTSKPGSHAGQPSGRPQTEPGEAENSSGNADQDGPSRQTTEAQDEKGQL
jgi:hypothetical protein